MSVQRPVMKEDAVLVTIQERDTKKKKKPVTKNERVKGNKDKVRAVTV